jgi:Ankyrin repeats (3 copies)
MFGAGEQIISYLVKKYPGGAKKSDFEGSTPLHLACDADKGVSTASVKSLVEKCPESCKMQRKTDLATPLHLAIARGAPVTAIKYLLKVSKEPVLIADARGNIPLHIAITGRADPATIQALVDADPACISSKNNDGETCLAIAEKLKLGENCLN